MGGEEKADGGPILLGCRGLSYRIVPCSYFTITYGYITEYCISSEWMMLVHTLGKIESGEGVGELLYTRLAV